MATSSERGGEPRLATKGSAFRGMVAWLEHEGLTPAVRAQVRAETARLLAAPPTATEWVDLETMGDLCTVVAALRGPRAPRDMAAFGMRNAVAPVLRPLIEGVLRVFGTRPDALFNRVGTTLNASMRGVEAAYRPLGEGAGVVEMTYLAPVAPAYLTAFEGSFVVVLEMCNVDGVVEPVDTSAGPLRPRYAMRWTPRRR